MASHGLALPTSRPDFGVGSVAAHGLQRDRAEIRDGRDGLNVERLRRHMGRAFITFVEVGHEFVAWFA